jgi:hypothetical protein
MDILLENKVKSSREVQGVQIACEKFGRGKDQNS